MITAELGTARAAPDAHLPGSVEHIVVIFWTAAAAGPPDRTAVDLDPGDYAMFAGDHRPIATRHSRRERPPSW